MNSILQLLRRPWKTLLGILLSLLACTIICVCLGQYIAAVQTQGYVEDNYTSVGLLTSKYMTETILDENGNSIGVTYYDQQPLKVQEFLLELSSAEYSSTVKAVQQSLFTSGYLPELTPLNYYGAGAKPISLDADATNVVSIDPYTYAMFEIVVDEVGAVRPYIDYQTSIAIDTSAYGYAVDLVGTISKVVSLQPGYSDPTGRPLRVTMRFETEADALALTPKTGERYLVCGTDYQDLDAQMRLTIAQFFGIEVSEVDWANIAWYTEEEISQLQFDWVADYSLGDGEKVSITEDEAQMINSCSLTVCPNPLLYKGQVGQSEIYLSTGVVSADDYAVMFQDSNFVRLEDPAEDFLNQTTDRFWSEWLNTAQVNDHSFPILAVDDLAAISQFAIQDAVLVEGRGFTQQETAHGEKVCVISESLAIANGLAVGDTISMQFYETDMDIVCNQTNAKLANPSASYYSSAQGFATDSEAFEIVGLYRQKNQWEQGTYCFTPNTIFVPKSVASAGAVSICGGIYTSVILENGTTSQLERLAAEHGFEGLFACYDQGYSYIMTNLQSYYEIGPAVLRIGLALWIGIILLYLFLFPLQLHSELNRMWELGTPPRKIRQHIFVSSAGVLLPGAICGCITSALLFGQMTQSIAAAAKSDLTLEVSVGTLSLIALVQLLVVLLIVDSFAWIVTASLKKHYRGK